MSKPTHLGGVVVGLLIALFIGALDVTVVSTAMPNIIGDLKGAHLISWVFTIYTLTTCVATPIFGKLTDLFGRKPVFAAGVLLFVVGSALCGVAQSMTALIAFRALQGIGAGALNPVCFTIVGDLFSGEKRGRMMGLFASVWSIAGLLGPLVGGTFVDRISWRWIFFINVPLGAIALVLVLFSLKERFEKQRKSIDYWGAVAFTISVSSLMYALLSGGDRFAWDSATMLGLFAVALAFLVLFLIIESRAKEPMMPLSIFRNRVMNVSNLSGFLAFAIVAGVTIYAPIWIQSVLGHSATNSGLTVMPMSIFWPIASNLVGRLMYRIGTKTSVVAGAILVTAGAGWLALLDIRTPFWHWTIILSILGFGMGFVSTPTTVMVQSAVGHETRGVAMAANSLLRSLGQTVGVAVFGMIFNSRVADPGSPTELVDGMHGIFVLMLGVAVVHVLATLLLPRQREETTRQASNQAG